MKREEVVRGLERFIDDYKRYINHADWQRVYNALALLKEQGTKVKPQFDDDALDRNTYIKVGDLIDCMTELSMPEDAAFHLAGAIEWACGKRAVALPKEQEARVIKEGELYRFQCKDVWIEKILSDYQHIVYAATLKVVSGYCIFQGTEYDETIKDYNVERAYGWRCWTARPTEEQMRETPWEEVRRET